MRFGAVLVALVCCLGANPPDPLSDSHLEAVHQQRVEWMKIRAAAPLPGVYQDFRAASAGGPVTPDLLQAARQAGVQILFADGGGPAEVRQGVLIAAKPAHLPVSIAPSAPEIQSARRRKHLKSEFKQYPQEVFALAGEAAVGAHLELALATSSTHILARDLSEPAIADALAGGRTYSAADWLCDPAGFFFIAENALGVYDIGDQVPLFGPTRLRVSLPISAKIAVERNGEVVAKAAGRAFTYTLKIPGDYRLRVSLQIDGETWRWIETNPIHVENARGLTLPSGRVSPEMEVHKDVAYVDDGASAHKLDLYLPKGKKSFPVMLFFHGGNWRTGDRSMYPLFGNRFALAGIGVAVPSYRLMPKDPYPAQIEDAAAAFAWIAKHIAEFGGDVSRIYVAGHSAGGHLAALLALDPKFLSKYGLDASSIRGVIAMSGVYDVRGLAGFQNADGDPSPIDHAHGGAPRFLITYCQWDYFDLPKQARDFAAALKEKFVNTTLVYIPGESHVSEIVNTLKPGDATARAILDFVK